LRTQVCFRKACLLSALRPNGRSDANQAVVPALHNVRIVQEVPLQTCPRHE